MFALLFETQPLIISLIHPTKYNRSPDSTFGFTRDALLMIRHKQHPFSSILSETPAWATNTTPAPLRSQQPQPHQKQHPATLLASLKRNLSSLCFATTFRAPKPSGASASIGEEANPFSHHTWTLPNQPRATITSMFHSRTLVTCDRICTSKISGLDSICQLCQDPISPNGFPVVLRAPGSSANLTTSLNC